MRCNLRAASAHMEITTTPDTTAMPMATSDVGLKAVSVAEAAASCGVKIIGEGMAPPLCKTRLAMRNARRGETLVTDE